MPESSKLDVLPVKYPEKTGKALRAFALVDERSRSHRPEVDGWDNYNEIASDPEANFVIAVSHRADPEITTAINVFASLRKLGVVTHSANIEDSRGRTKLGPRLLGKDNFLVHGVNREPGTSDEARSKDRYHLDPVELEVMAKRMMSERMTPIVAAHLPVYHSPLPKDPGLADVVLAHLSGTRTILPVSVDMGDYELVANAHEGGKMLKNLVTGKRTEAKVHIAPPIRLPEIPKDELDRAMMVLSSETRKQLTPEQQDQALQTLHLLRQQSGLVMQAIADRLPEDDRGVWGDKDTDPTDE